MKSSYRSGLTRLIIGPLPNGSPKNSPDARGGSTLTTPFTGLYTSTTQTRLVRDAIHVLFCDFDLDVNDYEQRAELTNYLNEIRLLLIEVLVEEEVWIIYHPVVRVGGPRP